MKLVIREYLSMLKESGELDVLLPDLILSMNLEPLSRPQIGTRQFGVDLPAVGIDPDDKVEKLFLFTIKCNDISRNDWDTGKNAIRPSLNEILDSYLRNLIRPKHENLPKKIVLVTGGEMKEEVSQDWISFTDRNGGMDDKYGEIEFDFWSGNKLSILIEDYLLDEYLFPESAQKKIRKTIALADQNEKQPIYFYSFLNNLLFKSKLPFDKKLSAIKKRQRALRLLNLSLNIIFYWCREADNLKPALYSAERAMLNTWGFIEKGALFKCNKTFNEFKKIFETYLNIGKEYAEKMEPYCKTRDGLYGFGADRFEYPLRCMEVLGILGSVSLAFTFYATLINNEEKINEYLDIGENITGLILSLFDSNNGALTPLYDEHSIDISLAFMSLLTVDEKERASECLNQISTRICVGCNIGINFPISTDSFNDLLSWNYNGEPSKEELIKFSTLIPMLCEFYVFLSSNEDYSNFLKGITENFNDTHFQHWYPDDETEKYLYQDNAGYKSGINFSRQELPKDITDLKEEMIQLSKERSEFYNLSFIKENWPMIGLIASRHFRTPVMPQYWQQSIS